MSDVGSEIQQIIRKQGPITFEQFMARALFSPNGGYYSSTDPVGADGDFYTSPSAHPLFGALICLQLEQMWGILGNPPQFWVVEAGAGNGLLARSILDYLDNLSTNFRKAMRYVAVDMGAAIKKPGERFDKVLAFGLPFKRLVGCILSNELVDAFPVHRFQVKDGVVQEVFVTYDRDRDTFTEILGKPSTPKLASRLPANLPEGFRGEVNLQIDPWSNTLAKVLREGFVLTFDYGDTMQGLYRSNRRNGTLQCHYKHSIVHDPYVRLGQQDITAHVDFSALSEAGERAGLTKLGVVSQRSFLENLGAKVFMRVFSSEARTSRTRRITQQDYLANRAGILSLLNPEGLGAFNVLVQAKGVDASQVELQGIFPNEEWERNLELSVGMGGVPRIRHEHTPIFSGLYPDQDIELGAWWPWSR
jgi:SAM-dependent MidA family methyltransferase